LSELADSILFEIDNDRATLSINDEFATGGLFLKRKVEGVQVHDTKQRTLEFEISALDRVSQRISPEYLLRILTIYTRCSDVKIRLKSDTPIRVCQSCLGW